MQVTVEIQSPIKDEQAFGTCRGAINWVKSHTDVAVIKLDGHVAYKFERGKLLWNDGSKFEPLYLS